ncbi:ADP-ribosylglycohydrolase family protein [Streptomyces sp. NPDC001941]|uniref:ADP-ribosylglycohydrolase family protein n=1 Tax=Streptomyces sp. NPDC001941 TaxID=3154659 RepID=UPI00333404B6
MLSDSALLDRGRGALLGLAIGDALGAPAENMSREEIRAKWGRVEGFVSDEPAGTDDTEYAIFSSLGLIKHGSLLTHENVEEAWRNCLLPLGADSLRGAGFSERGTLENLRRGLRAPLSAQHRHGWSDGLAMRATPFGVYACGQPAEAARLVAVDGMISHEGEGIYGGMAVASGVACAITGASVESVVDAALASVPEDSWTFRALARAVRTARDLAPWDLHPGRAEQGLAQAAVIPGYPWTDVAPEAVSLAFGAFVLADGNFAPAVLAAVNMGRDADTTAAIAGALAGARCGAPSLPPQWTQAIGPVAGTCLPSTAGIHIGTLAERLLNRRQRESPQWHARSSLALQPSI